MKCLFHNWYYFPRISRTNATVRFCRRCGKHQSRAYWSSKWKELYSFNQISSIGVRFLDAINALHKQPKSIQNAMQGRTWDDLCLWYTKKNPVRRAFWEK